MVGTFTTGNQIALTNEFNEHASKTAPHNNMLFFYEIRE